MTTTTIPKGVALKNMDNLNNLTIDEDWRCPNCRCNQYHCLCDVVGRPLTKKESAELYWLAATDIEKFNELCEKRQDNEYL